MRMLKSNSTQKAKGKRVRAISRTIRARKKATRKKQEDRFDFSTFHSDDLLID